MTKHNKKRNVGIIYEQIISFICNKTIEKDDDSAKKAIAIIKSRFKEGTQLRKEHKLFNALASTKGISSSLSTSIINEAKLACNYHFDDNKLEIEKSNLIKDLNYAFGKGTIFEQKVKNYKTYATIQTLLNEWRKEDRDISKVALFETNLQKWMVEPLEEKPKHLIKKVDPLVLKIMKEKFEKKYQNILTESQKNILAFYFANIEKNEEAIFEKFSKIKKDALNELLNYKSSCTNSFLLESFSEVYSNIENINVDSANNKTLKQILTASKLIEEIKE